MTLVLAVLPGVGYALSVWSLWRQMHFKEPPVANPARRTVSYGAACSIRTAER